MLKALSGFFKKALSSKGFTEKQNNCPSNSHTNNDFRNLKVNSDINKNIDILQNSLGENNDVIFRKFLLGFAENTEMAAVFIDGMVDTSVINNNVLKPLIIDSKIAKIKPDTNLVKVIKEKILSSSEIQEVCLVKDLINGILYGSVVLLTDGQATALIIDAKGWVSRSISEPDSEVLVRGPREGFTENLRTNTTLLRRRLRSPNLVIENHQLGRITNTGVTLTYIRGLASPDIVKELKNRLSRIDVDGILESGYIEEFIEDSSYSPFPQVLHTERPDRVASALLEGKIAVLTDGTPIALVVPTTLASFLQSPEDYYERYILGSAIRLLRYFAFAVSLLAPSLYIAITTFHQEMIPTQLLFNLVASREGVPFPAIMEALLMEFTFEVLREAGIRLPRAVGQAVSIVGALVIGQAAVQAGIVSPMMVIVVALTGISSFTNPAFNVAISMRLLRFPIMLLAATLGLFGVMAGILAILIHLAGLRSFGVPYLTPLAPFKLADLKDTVIRVPWWAMDKRPSETGKLNQYRQIKKLKPTPYKNGQKG